MNSFGQTHHPKELGIGFAIATDPFQYEDFSTRRNLYKDKALTDKWKPEFKKYAEQNLIVFLVDLPGGGFNLNSKVYQDYQKFKNKYQTNALPSLI